MGKGSDNAPSDAERLADARRAAAFLDRALVLAGVSVWRVDLRTRRIHFNVIGFQVNGLVEDPAGLPLDAHRDNIHPEDREAVIRAADEALASDRVVDVVARYLRPDGQWITLLTRRVADRDAEGRAIGLAGVSLDLSAQVAERERAEALAARTRLVVDALGAGFWTRDVDSGRLEWDEQVYRIHRRDPALGPPAFDEWLAQGVHPADRAWVAERLHQADVAWEPSTDLLFRLPDDEGGERWVQTWARRVVRGGRRLAFGMHLDVSAGQRTRLARQREHERAQFALAAAEIGIWERDRHGRVVYLNEVMYRQRGLEPSDPRSPEEIAHATTHPDDLPRVQALVQQALASGLPYRHELRIRRGDGAWRWVATQGQALHDASGQVLGMAGVHIDITERKLADALQREKERLEQASRDKSAFMARMSHELRTPMNAVLGFARLLEDDALEPPTPRQRERLARISGAGERLLALIDDVLELARLEAESAPPSAQPVPLSEVLREAAAAVAGVAERAGVALQLPDSAPGLALADRRRLVQALGHVLLQRVHESAPGSALVLETALEPAGPGGPEAPARALIRVHAPAPRPAAVPTAGQAQLFDLPAGTAAAADAARDIGLRLALRLLAAIDGDVEQAADGAHVLRVPAALPASPAPAALPRHCSLHVLCVEDNPVNLQLVRELFALRPTMRLSTAVDGQGGIDAALAEPPDLVLLDLQLPDINGIEVLQRLRQAPALDRCRMVALSADAMAEHIEKAMAAGFDDYWTKPIHFDRFLADLDRLALDLATAQAATPAVDQGASRSRSH